MLVYFSKIENLDKAIIDFEEATVNTGGTMQAILYQRYFETKNNGNTIIDARIGYQLNEHHKWSLVVANALNKTYSLRPLKIEPMRTVMLQYSLKF